jgi:hypothetical protein
MKSDTGAFKANGDDGAEAHLLMPFPQKFHKISDFPGQTQAKQPASVLVSQIALTMPE